MQSRSFTRFGYLLVGGIVAIPFIGYPLFVNHFVDRRLFVAHKAIGQSRSCLHRVFGAIQTRLWMQAPRLAFSYPLYLFLTGLATGAAHLGYRSVSWICIYGFT